MQQFLSRTWKGFSHLFFPFQCLGCELALDMDEDLLCKSCQEGLPLTHYWKDDENPVAQMFWGKVDLENACSYLYFYQGGSVQRMLHALKYKRNPTAGVYLGKHFGSVLQHTKYAACDCLIPVPLHLKKQRKRGYNQCAVIAEGMAEVMNVPIENEAMIRAEHHDSQTKKGRYERWLNVRSRFKVTDSDRIAGKHILLVDDVVTTGATLEACASILLEVPGTKVSVATVACPAPF